MNRSEYVATIAPIAKKLWNEGCSLWPSVRLAQTLLETGGQIHAWNNLVGYKVGSGRLTPYWSGASVNTSTWEVYNGVKYDDVKSNWRAYDSIENCFRDQELLFQLDRYKAVREATTPEDQAVALYRCGYATDPEYYVKIIAIAKPYKYLDTPRKSEGKGGPELEKWVAQTIVNTWLKPAWDEANEEGHEEDKKNIRLLGNKLRLACGMKEDEEFE
jgi:flagellar protein FlgJ